MCFFKKKRKIVRETINSKFDIGEFVHFRYRDELYFGYVLYARRDIDGNVIYDIQVGGQCPAVIKGIKEEIIFIKK